MSKAWVLVEVDHGEDELSVELFGTKELAHTALKPRLLAAIAELERFDVDIAGKTQGVKTAITQNELGIALGRWNKLIAAPKNFTLVEKEIQT